MKYLTVTDFCAYASSALAAAATQHRYLVNGPFLSSNMPIYLSIYS